MTTVELDGLKRSVATYHEKWKERGGKLTSYTCPSCKAQIDTPRPRRADVGSKGFWDSMKVCTECGEICMLTTYPSGRTETISP